MPIQTKVSRDIEKFEDLENKLKGYKELDNIDYYELQKITREYREYLRLATKYMKSPDRILEINKIYSGLLQRMENQRG